jgi:adenylosuccinate synthase
METKFNLNKIVITYGEGEEIVQFNNFPEATAFYELAQVMPVNVAKDAANVAYRIWLSTQDTKYIRRVAEVVGDAITIFGIGFENYEKLMKYVKKNY